MPLACDTEPHRFSGCAATFLPSTQIDLAPAANAEVHLSSKENLTTASPGGSAAFALSEIDAGVLRVRYPRSEPKKRAQIQPLFTIESRASELAE
jgi:hypothetical protein